MRARGLTLIEVTVALGIAALLVAVTVPALNNVTRAQLKQKAGQLSGAVRSMYGSTAIAGKTCRLVLDLDAGAFWSECAKGAARISREQERAREGAREKTRAEEELEELALRDAEHLTEEERTRLELRDKSAFAASKDIEKTELGSSVKFTDVWVQHQAEPFVRGQAHIYFWPHGQTEAAAIHLAQSDDTYTLLVSPMTGRVKIVNERVEAPEQKK
jgi:general secretion pathway protein H